MNQLDPLAELRSDPDRTPIDGAREVVSVRGDDEEDFLAALAARSSGVVELERRGHYHGRIAVLDRDATPPVPRPSLVRRRFCEARPVVFGGAVAAKLLDWRNELFEAERLGERLVGADELGAFLRRRLARTPRFRLVRCEAGGFDRERDVATAHVADERTPGVDLWIKTARLSTSASDASMRLRFGFGREPDDESSGDVASHRALTDLARVVLPELALVEKGSDLFDRVSAAADAPLGPVCPIAYWNRPSGGALFHHDAFAALEEHAQRGVLFVQLVGATVWLALSTAQLARRVREFAALLERGELDWLDEKLAGTGVGAALERLLDDDQALYDELGRPGQGDLGPLIEVGPEFTTFLADSGHATVLAAGDAIVLPNHGWRATAMHSVFCAGEGPNYALSLGLREVASKRAVRRR